MLAVDRRPIDDIANLYVIFIRRGEKERALRTIQSVRMHDETAHVVAIVEAQVQIDDHLTAATDGLATVDVIEARALWVLRQLAWAMRQGCEDAPSGSDGQIAYDSITKLSPDVLITGTLAGVTGSGMVVQETVGTDVSSSFWTVSPELLPKLDSLLQTGSYRNIEERAFGRLSSVVKEIQVKRQGQGFLSGFSYQLSPGYDMSRFKKLSRAVFFHREIDEAGLDLRSPAMREMLSYWRGEGFDWKALNKIPLERIGAGNMASGDRPEAAYRLRADVLMAVATVEVAGDLERLLPTACYHMPERPFHLVADEGAACAAERIRDRLGLDNLVVHRWITPESLVEAEAKLSHLTNHSDYWKPGPIWWKLEGLRRVIDLYSGNRGVLMVDSDIVFATSVDEEFRGVDVVLSPFHWPDPTWKVRKDPALPAEVHIAQRDGWYNAGYLLTKSAAVVQAWLDLYESGRGGFYEQWVMGFLPQLFRHDVFGTAHNWGQWRKEAPRAGVVSLHIHAWTKHGSAHGRAVQEAAEAATDIAVSQLARWQVERYLDQ